MNVFFFFTISEADRARDYYKSKGGVNLIDLDEAEKLGNARAMIYNNRVKKRLIYISNYIWSYSNSFFFTLRLALHQKLF